VLDTVPVQHDLKPYLATLKYDGAPILVGLLDPVEPPVNAGALVYAMPRPGRVADRGQAGAAGGTGLLRGARYLV